MEELLEQILEEQKKQTELLKGIWETVYQTPIMDEDGNMI